jgi:hypothetical protein
MVALIEQGAPHGTSLLGPFVVVKGSAGKRFKRSRSPSIVPDQKSAKATHLSGRQQTSATPGLAKRLAVLGVTDACAVSHRCFSTAANWH